MKYTTETERAMRYLIEVDNPDTLMEIARQHNWTVLSPMKPALSTEQAAVKFGVHPNTIRRWVDNALIDSFTTPGGHRRIPVDAAPIPSTAPTARAKQRTLAHH